MVDDLERIYQVNFKTFFSKFAKKKLFPPLEFNFPASHNSAVKKEEIAGKNFNNFQENRNPYTIIVEVYKSLY